MKRLAARLPKRWQQSLKRQYFGRQINRRRFDTWEPEYHQLHTLVSPGDWVLDIGANVGHYTVRLAELVGAQGRVIAFEPVPETFELLASNVALLPSKNVTLVNAAASDKAGVAGMVVPLFETGLDNHSLAHLTKEASSLHVLCLPIDALALPHAVRLVKIDAEGHELSVLRGMSGLLRRDRPVLIVEDSSAEVDGVLQGLGYAAEKLAGSSNRVFRCPGPRGEQAEGANLERRVSPEGIG